MFWLDVLTTSLCYFAVLSLLERASKTQWFKTHVGDESIIELFGLIQTFSSGCAITFVFSVIFGMSPQLLFDAQSWFLGYLCFHAWSPFLYPELEFDSYNLLMLFAASYLFSYGIYHWIYSLSFLLTTRKVMETYYRLIPANNSQLWNNFIRGELGLLVFLTLLAIFTINLLPAVFFATLLARYARLIQF